MTLLETLDDYPALRQLQEALWGVGESRGAAVMIGAGFSRMATRLADDAPHPPLWGDFAKVMQARLGHEHPSGDPLKLAEEYAVSLGRHALDSLIRELVTDERWRPGEAHARLLGLPWADVLTTNWDTLLERTDPIDPERTYEVVLTSADIARKRAPRITKLHGSLPSHDPLTFTAEDFRKYPQEFAPFVNLAQQVLLENELCLIGFSGDDPNFLQWAGWVRDHLGKQARRIRLIGVLQLSASQRQVLEHNNITPIDLFPIVKHLEPAERHGAAIDLLLDSFWAAKPRAPYDWDLNEKDDEGPSRLVGIARLQHLVAAWTKARQAYPGWLVAPADCRMRLFYGTPGDNEVPKLLKAADPSLLARTVYELIWRTETALAAPDGWLLNAVREVLALAPCPLTREEQGELLECLLRVARDAGDSTGFSQTAERLEALAPGHPGLAYERALEARDRMDYIGLQSLIPAIQGDDPIWLLRRASLYADLGATAEVKADVRGALREIHQRRSRDRRSIWLLSREAWAAFVSRWLRWDEHDQGDAATDKDAASGRFKGGRTDPWDHFAAFSHELEEIARQRRKDEQPIRAQFDAGVYRDSSSSTRFVSRTAATELTSLRRLCERAGVPSQVEHVNLSAHRIRAGLEEIQTPTAPLIRLAAWHANYGEGILDRYFSRVAVARMLVDEVDALLVALRGAITFALPRLDRSVLWLEVARNKMEILSRLMVRLPSAQASEFFRWGLSLMQDPRWAHRLLFEPLAHLLQRALEAIPTHERHHLAWDVLRAPLASERQLNGGQEDWPDVIWSFKPSDFRRPAGDPAWTQRIEALIRLARHPGETRVSAIWRLVQLHHARVLSEPEQAQFAAALWAGAPVGSLPINTRVRPHSALLTPEPTPGRARAAFEAEVVEGLASGELTEQNLIGLQSAAMNRDIRTFPDRDTALRLFDKLLAWRPRPSRELDIFNEAKRHNDEIARVIGSTLADAVLPPLASDDLTPRQISALVRSLGREDAYSLISAAVQALRLDPTSAQDIIAVIRRALSGQTETLVSYALDAVRRFVDTANAPPIPSVLVSDVVGICALRRDVGLLPALNCARKLLIAGVMPVEDQARLLDSLEALLSETDYANWSERDPRTRSLTLVRAACVKLSAALFAAGFDGDALRNWLALPQTDPAPEVRFALDGMEAD